jgi:hypothetical protein
VRCTALEEASVAEFPDLELKVDIFVCQLNVALATSRHCQNFKLTSRFVECPSDSGLKEVVNAIFLLIKHIFRRRA